MSETTSAVNVEIQKTVITSGIATVKKEITAPVTIGSTGRAGADGADGEDGMDGADGVAGPAGPVGPAGAPGLGLEVLEPRVSALEECGDMSPADFFNLSLNG